MRSLAPDGMAAPLDFDIAKYRVFKQYLSKRQTKPSSTTRYGGLHTRQIESRFFAQPSAI